METLKTGIPWIDEVIPEGLPLKTTTVITGPGGSGKPLIGEAFVAAWLREGGSVAIISLQYPDSTFVDKSIRNITGLDVGNYSEHICFVQLDTNIPGYQVEKNNNIRANLVRPEVWDNVLQVVTSILPDEGPGVLVFASALNLLLFSPTYSEATLKKLTDLMTTNKDSTYLFTVSTTVKAEQVAKLEEAADNLIVSRSKQAPFRLYMQVLRIAGVESSTNEILIPVLPETLKQMKSIAHHSRSVVIPAISKM